MLEFLALIVLRIREPNLPRPFRVPGGTWGAALIGVCPLLLLCFSILRGDHEQILGISSLLFGALVIAAGFVAYAADVTLRPIRPLPAGDAPEE